MKIIPMNTDARSIVDMVYPIDALNNSLIC